MDDLLQTMSVSSKERAERTRSGSDALQADSAVHKLALNDFGLIAEIKNRSPAEGELAARAGDRSKRARAYVQGGAAAISVLTEPDRFDGALAHLEEVVAAIADNPVPVMRKDFLVDTVQITEARAAGASGVLLIAAMLDDQQLRRMLDCVFEHDMFVLLEAFDETDLQRSVSMLQLDDYRQQAQQHAFLLGINTRNLRTLEVDQARLANFGPKLPPHVVTVAESGMHTPADVAQVAQLGYGAALVGTALMRAADPVALIDSMRAAGQAVRQ